MDQSEIDALLSGGNLEKENKKQQEIVDNLTNTTKDSSKKTSENKAKDGISKLPRKGEVMGQLSKVSEEAEEGTTLVMNYLENMLNIAQKQKEYTDKLENDFKNNSLQKSTKDIIAYFKDSSFLFEDLIFTAMDAFQFQDINRQKLMKVMHTLAQLNNYLNDLLGNEDIKEDGPVNFGRNIEEKTLVSDHEKKNVDDIVAQYQNSQN